MIKVGSSLSDLEHQPSGVAVKYICEIPVYYCMWSEWVNFHAVTIISRYRPLCVLVTPFQVEGGGWLVDLFRFGVPVQWSFAGVSVDYQWSTRVVPVE